MCSVCYLVKYPDSLVLMNQFGNYYSRLFLSCYDIQSHVLQVSTYNRPNIPRNVGYIKLDMYMPITGWSKIKPHF